MGSWDPQCGLGFGPGLNSGGGIGEVWNIVGLDLNPKSCEDHTKELVEHSKKFETGKYLVIWSEKACKLSIE